ncbi:MAG: DUF481 domain-containing protein [Alteromonadaceae bacterium]|nr:DUF481 domain-containing protein [Alteromonadaceae bacterium]
MKKMITFAMLASVANVASAQEETKTFKMDGEFGLIATSGNTDTSSVKARLSANHELENWSNEYLIEGLYKQDEVEISDGVEETQTTAQKYFFSAQGNYKLENPDNRLFAYASYEDDRFSSFEYQATVAGGWNSVAFKTEDQSLSYSIGPGYGFSETTEGEDTSSLIVRAAANYDWTISSTASFKQVVSTEIGSDNTKSRSESSVSAKIGESLSMKFSIILNHNSDVADDRENLDTETAATLVYTFF